MGLEHLDDEERGVIEALRRARSGAAARPLPVLTREEFARRLRTDLGLGQRTALETLKKLDRATIRYNGPRVILDGTLADLQTSWKLHQDDLILKGASSAVLRHHREAVTRYLKCAGVEWAPETSVYERRGRAARTARTDTIELPEDFIARAHAVVHDVEYHKNAAVNAMFQYRARVAFHTAPRIPSEDTRLRLGDIHFERSVITYRQSKIAGPEGDAVLVPREVFDVPADVLTHPRRMSLDIWINSWRPRLMQSHWVNGRGRTTSADHDYVWAGPLGTPLDAEKYRQQFGAHAKTEWPGFYPYMCREVGIIMKAVEIAHERGHIDLELLAQWSGHEKLDNLRRYLRKGRQLLREAGTKRDVAAMLTEWREV